MIFLRSYFLILLLLPFLFLWLRQKNNAQNTWKKWVDARLLPYLLHTKTKSTQKRSVFGLITLIWSLWVLALAGPAGQTHTPAYLNTNSTVIVLDLNSTGRGAELIKVKAKLADILTKLSDEQVALVLYDSKGYTVTPLTQDKNILRSLIPTLGADVLPTAQNNPVKGFETAERLFQNLNLSNGRILFITAGGFNPEPVATKINTLPYQTALLFVPLNPEDTPPTVKAHATERLTADDSDINALIAATPLTAQAGAQTNTSLQTVQDFGIYLVLLSIPFLLYLFRKNLIFLIFLSSISTAQANIFWRPDQQAYQTAQQAFEAFQNKEYQKAYDLFYNPTDADALYNAAGALAYAGQIPEAIALYEQALALNPAHADALYNKEYLEKQLPKNNANNAENDNSAQTDSQNENNADDSQNQSEQQPETDEKNQSDSANNQSSQNPEQSDFKTDTQPPSFETADTTKESTDTLEESTDTTPDTPPSQSAVPPQNPEQSEQTNQETQQLFNRIQEDPSRLLRYRLYQQYRRQP